MIAQILLIQIGTFIALIIVLRMIFYRQLNAALRRLKALHEDNLAREAELKKEIEATRQQREAELAKAREESAAMLQEARQKAERLVSEMQAEAAQRIEYAAQQNAVKLKVLGEELENRQNRRILQTSLEIFRVVLSATGRENFQHMLVAELLGDIAALDASLFAGCAGARVTSAYPLQEQERTRLAQLLSEKAGRPVGLSESIDEGIIAGLVIQAGVQVLDGSLKNKIEKVVAFLNSQRTGNS